MRLRNKAQGWTEERGPTLGIEQAGHRYTEGVAEPIGAPKYTTSKNSIASQSRYRTVDSGFRIGS
jgi:hypothetical protein